MKKVFISQPMRGKTDEEILAVREKATQIIKDIYLGEDVEIIDSFFQSAPADAKPLWYLGESLKLLATADVAYFAPGWEDMRGCKIENTCAEEYGIPTIEDYKDAEEPGSFNFGVAIECVKGGCKAARKGWNGKGQYIQLATGISYTDVAGNVVNAEHDAIGNRAIAFVGTSGVQLGWLASQADMLAEDWVLVLDNEEKEGADHDD